MKICILLRESRVFRVLAVLIIAGTHAPLARAEIECKKIYNQFEDLLAANDQEEAIADSEAEATAAKMVNDIVTALKSNDMEKIAAIGDNLAREYSMDASNLGLMFDQGALKKIEGLSTVGKDGEKLANVLIDSHRKLQDQLKVIQSAKTQAGNFIEKFAGYVGLGNWVKNWRDSRITLDAVIATNEKAIAEYSRLSKAVLDEIPKIIEETHVKNRKNKIDTAALMKVVEEMKSHLALNESRMSAEKLSQFRTTLNTLMMRVEIAKSIYAGNVLKINELYALFSQTRDASIELSMRGSASLEEVRTNIAIVFASDNVAKMNELTINLSKTAEESRRVGLLALEAGVVSREKLRDTVKAAAVQLGLDSQKLIDLTVKMVAGEKTGAAFSQQVIDLLDATTAKLEKNEKDFKANNVANQQIDLTKKPD